MADQYAVNHKKRHVTVPAKLTDVADQGGRMRMLYDKFTFTSPNIAMQINDTISFGKLPPGAKVWDATLHQSATLGTSCQLSLGYTGAATAFLAAAVATGAGTRYMREGVSNITQAPVTITSEVTVMATLTAAVSSSTAAFVEVRIYYTVD
tara:strand:- start:37607 stop:38059 length:453 start_codon:yes stop_codon:yes gene_type:complete